MRTLYIFHSFHQIPAHSCRPNGDLAEKGQQCPSVRFRETSSTLRDDHEGGGGRFTWPYRGFGSKAKLNLNLTSLSPSCLQTAYIPLTEESHSITIILFKKAE